MFSSSCLQTSRDLLHIYDRFFSASQERLAVPAKCHVRAYPHTLTAVHLHPHMSANSNQRLRTVGHIYRSNFASTKQNGSYLQLLILKSVVNLYSGLHPGDAVTGGHRSRTVSVPLCFHLIHTLAPFFSSTHAAI